MSYVFCRLGVIRFCLHSEDIERQSFCFPFDFVVPFGFLKELPKILTFLRKKTSHDLNKLYVNM